MASKYVLVYNDITTRIQSGMYPAGSRLPAENLLIREYGVSRDTLRKALAMLEQDGYIQKARGREALVLDRDWPWPKGIRPKPTWFCWNRCGAAGN